jgi:hypothetical protein
MVFSFPPSIYMAVPRLFLLCLHTLGQDLRIYLHGSFQENAGIYIDRTAKPPHGTPPTRPGSTVAVKRSMKPSSEATAETPSGILFV